jgi:uncharacterized membrane protein
MGKKRGSSARPLPPPKVLREYEDLVPGSGQKIIELANLEQQHILRRAELAKAELNARIVITARLIRALIVAGAAVCVVCLMAVVIVSLVSTTTISTTVATVATVGLVQLSFLLLISRENVKLSNLRATLHQLKSSDLDLSKEER